MMNRKWIVAALCTVLLTGCSDKVVTVADISAEDGKDTQYIEMQEFELKEPAAESGREGDGYCVVLIPSSYQESEEVPGMYVHKRSPLDSSNIYYTISAGNENGMVSGKLTGEIYENLLEDAYREAGQEIDLKIKSFEEIDLEGIPGYKIRSSYQVAGGEIEQLAYLILGQDTYTITYSQMSDDELLADFEISDGEIRLVRNDEVSLARSGEEN